MSEKLSLHTDIDLIEAKIWELQSLLRRKKWEYLGAGRHRIAYRAPNRNRVIKIAHCPEGIIANKEEWQLSRDPNLLSTYLPHCKGIQVANVFGIGVTLGLSILCMEWVDQWSVDLSNCPFWVKNVDKFRVGYNESGNLVAFDFSRC